MSAGQGNTIEDLRGLLFDTIRDLRDPDCKHIDEDRAAMISHVGQTVIESAKVEVDMVRAVGGGKVLTPFMDMTPKIESKTEVKTTGIGDGGLHTSKMNSKNK